MANWGLLGGLGAGLSQFGATLNQGLNADIAAKQREDIETRREASIEKRWARQEARANRQEQAQSERWAKQDARQAERDQVSDSQFDRTATSRENSVIESNISGIMQSKQKALEDLTKRYQKQAVDSMGQPLQGDALVSLNEQMKGEAEQVRDRYNKMLDTRVKSYGERLRGTGFSYLLDVPDIEEIAPEASGQGNSINSLGPNINDLASKILSGQSNTDLEAELLKAMPYPESMSKIKRPTSGELEPTFLNALNRSFGGTYGRDPLTPIRTDRTPLESAAVVTGDSIGALGGLLGDAAQMGNDKVVQPVWDWANTRSSQR